MNTSESSTIPIALFVIGGVFLVSGWKGSNLVDTFSGQFKNDWGGGGSGTTPATTAPVPGGDLGAGTKGYGAIESGLSYAGPDQGIDFTGRGSIYAPSDLEITRVDLHSGWPGGHIIVGKILGPHPSGKDYVYFAEALNPAPGIRKGARIPAGSRIATLDSSYPGTEIGFAQDPRGTAYGTTSDGKNGNAAPYGRAFLNWLLSLGNPTTNNRLSRYPH